ncbi:CBM96 family carbohydrate-binding protein [Dyadobacter sediminis]|uniref:DNRLRE domain-containing protein n=1 Tax=Dyadobacter sediminis TaxID=1493691 RepID=A0A5R9K6N4_9BACT|nr:malectin domain-containing carbohydrate-binding protein [Dyadobacter sediminis]TLU89450.1 DNRLRE domain-containing protein [Dyadobacter sediminis]GGC05304.1 hypothetical protein GCM10011325_35240 [Dyadobacter sediminis]
MKKIALLFFICFFAKHANAQSCQAPSFTSQQQIDDFKIQNPACKIISGNVLISGIDITNLNGLSEITAIHGNLTIANNEFLANLIGLGSLASVEGRLTISDNPSLRDVNGLESLRLLENGINVVSNQVLTNFSGLKSISNVGPYLRIVYNPSLTSIDAFSKITTVTDFLSVGGNDMLESLSGLENITVAREVSISLNNRLRNLNGLRSLTKTTGYLYIGSNPMLTDLQGLNNLKSVSNYFEINSNNGLTSLNGLDNLTTADALVIHDSKNLSACSVKAICSILSNNPEGIGVYSNASGCNSTEEVAYYCSTPTAPVRINAGGGTFTTATKKVFSADQYYAGIDRISTAVSGDILNTSNDPLYQTARCSPAFSYNIPVANGEVSVYLHFAETYYGAPGKKGGAGSRLFHVNMEGVRKLTNYDIFAKAGGAMRATAETFTVNVTDGMLNIDFLTGAADLPRVSAIEVIKTGLTLQPNADAYIRDGIYNNTNYGSESNLDIKNTVGELSPKRSSYLRFQLPANTGITSAKLRVYGHNHENNKDISVHAYGVDDDSWTEYGIVRSNAPVVSTLSLGYVAVNSVYKYYEIDVSSYVKAQQQAGDAQVSFLLADPNNRNTRVVFNSKENVSFPPQLFVQTTPVVNSNTRLNQEIITLQPEIQDDQESTVYPNPVKKQFTVGISIKHAGRISLELINESGKGYAIPAAENARAGEKTDVDISGLSLHTGIYLLKINSDATTEIIKVLVEE